MPGPGQPDRLAPPAVLLELLGGHRPRAHRVRPVLVIAVLDEERDRAAQRAAVADAAERPHVVLLELLARAAAVARLAAGEVAADQLVVELDARRHAADDDRQAGPVRFAGGDVGELHRVAKPIRGPVPRGVRNLWHGARLQFGAPRADEHDAVFGVIRAVAVVAAIAVAAGCGQASGSDSVVHPATFHSDGQGAGSTGAVAKMPSSAEATRIVRELWTQREDVIGRLDADGLRRDGERRRTGDRLVVRAVRDLRMQHAEGGAHAAARRPDHPQDVGQRLVHGGGADAEHHDGRTALVHRRRDPGRAGRGRSDSSRSAGTRSRRR